MDNLDKMGNIRAKLYMSLYKDSLPELLFIIESKAENCCAVKYSDATMNMSIYVSALNVSETSTQLLVDSLSEFFNNHMIELENICDESEMDFITKCTNMLFSVAIINKDNLILHL